MAINHRAVLRLATDAALSIFLLFAVGAALWIADEFLDWNVLPDWIDRYAQLVIVVFGIAAGLAVGTSLLCSVVVLAESAAARAGISEGDASKKLRRVIGWSAVLFGVALVVFHKIDQRRGKELEAQRRTELRETFDQQVADLRVASSNLVLLAPGPVKEALARPASPEGDTAIIQFVTAAQSSTPHSPAVSLLAPAEDPYRYVLLRLARSGDRGRDGASDYLIERRFFFGFPTLLETEVIESLFGGAVPALSGPVDGEVINNIKPSAWARISDGDGIVALMILRSDGYFPGDFFHTGGGVTLEQEQEQE